MAASIPMTRPAIALVIAGVGRRTRWVGVIRSGAAPDAAGPARPVASCRAAIRSSADATPGHRRHVGNRRDRRWPAARIPRRPAAAAGRARGRAGETWTTRGCARSPVRRTGRLHGRSGAADAAARGATHGRARDVDDRAQDAGRTRRPDTARRPPTQAPRGRGAGGRGAAGERDRRRRRVRGQAAEQFAMYGHCRHTARCSTAKATRPEDAAIIGDEPRCRNASTN